jgi:hypothetical protein
VPSRVSGIISASSSGQQMSVSASALFICTAVEDETWLPKECFAFLSTLLFLMGVCGNVVVKALCYKPEDLGFETRSGE